ncbi:MAG TPA: hypothetical protein VFC00_13565 [Micromonosporaceae bacterium]|nr:hypothetical protein [Micromonosporaceae bacterium]
MTNRVPTPKKATTPRATTKKATAAKKTTTAKKTAGRKRTTTKATTQPRRLPDALRITGEILMDRPPQNDGLAHRRLLVTDTDDGITHSPVHGALTAACRPLTDGQLPGPYAQFSAGWADHFYHAVACPDCFSDASPALPEVTP